MGQVRRRQLLFATSALLAVPFAHAQGSQKVRRIGLLWLPTFPTVAPGLALLAELLRRAGYEEGRNLVIERRSADGKEERLLSLARELVRSNVEVIVTWPNSATEAAIRATETIPIVMLSSFLPVENRYVRSLARPGGNVTGTAGWVGLETSDKMFQILKEAHPKTTRVTILWDPTQPGIRFLDLAQQDRNLAAIGITVSRIAMTRPDELGVALEQVGASNPDALYVSASVQSRERDIAAFALQRKLVTLGDAQTFVRVGGLLFYGPELISMMDRTASYVDRILRGAKPAELPVEHVPKWELILNSKTARAIGFAPPQSFLLRVDQLLE